MSSQNQLECRIVKPLLPQDKRIKLGMFDPVTMRYEALGTHGPSQQSY